MYEKLYTRVQAEIDRRATFGPTGRTEKSTGFLSRPETNKPVVEPDVMMDLMEGLKRDTVYYEEEVPNITREGVGTAREALGFIESTDNYGAKGPVMTKGMYKGDRAYGKYQVMGKNIPVWTKQVLGKAMTPQQFLNDTNAQDEVAAHKLQESFDRYGTWDDAASVWFSGRPMSKAGDASDGYNTVPEYVQKFRKAYQRILKENK